MTCDVKSCVKYLGLSRELIEDKAVRETIKTERKDRFWICVLISFGIPVMITAIVMIIDLLIKADDHKCSKLMVKFGDIDFFYTYLPVSIMLLCAIFFYSFTGYKIYLMNRKLTKSVESKFSEANQELLRSSEITKAHLKLEIAR